MFLTIFLNLFVLSKLRKFNENKIIALWPVAFSFRDNFCRSKIGFDRLKILSQCGWCGVQCEQNDMLHVMLEAEFAVAARAGQQLQNLLLLTKKSLPRMGYFTLPQMKVCVNICPPRLISLTDELVSMMSTVLEFHEGLTCDLNLRIGHGLWWRMLLLARCRCCCLVPGRGEST